MSLLLVLALIVSKCVITRGQFEPTSSRLTEFKLRGKHVSFPLLGPLGYPQSTAGHLTSERYTQDLHEFRSSRENFFKGYEVHEDVDDAGSEIYNRHVDIGDGHYTYSHVKKPPHLDIEKIPSVPLGNLLVTTSDHFGAVILGEEPSSGLSFLTADKEYVGKSLKILTPTDDTTIKQIQYPVPVKISQPLIVKIPVPVKIQKTVHVPVAKEVPYPIENPVAVKVVKKIHFPVPHHYPVPVPVYHTKVIVHGKE